MPVKVVLTPAKRSIYTAGLSYGSTNGAGVRLGVERRYLNHRGHKALAEIDWAQRRKVAPRSTAFRPSPGSRAGTPLGLKFVDEQTDYIDNRRADFFFSRSGEINDTGACGVGACAARTLGLHRRGRRRSAHAARLPVRHRVLSGVRGEYINVDQRLAPRRGWGGNALLRGGVGGAGSDATFVQAHAHCAGSRAWARTAACSRAASSATPSAARIGLLPPTLRFHAGGDRSIRGYGWREVGPRVGPVGDEFPVGARNVVTGSIEYERYFNGPVGRGGVRRHRQRLRSTRRSCAPASASACAGARRSGRCASTSRTGWTIRIRRSRSPQLRCRPVDGGAFKRTRAARTGPDPGATRARIAGCARAAARACATSRSAAAARRRADAGGGRARVLAVEHHRRPRLAAGAHRAAPARRCDAVVERGEGPARGSADPARRALRLHAQCQPDDTVRARRPDRVHARRGTSTPRCSRCWGALRLDALQVRDAQLAIARKRRTVRAAALARQPAEDRAAAADPGRPRRSMACACCRTARS